MIRRLGRVEEAVMTVAITRTELDAAALRAAATRSKDA
jgi:hypothetical protein